MGFKTQADFYNSLTQADVENMVLKEDMQDLRAMVKQLKNMAVSNQQQLKIMYDKCECLQKQINELKKQMKGEE